MNKKGMEMWQIVLIVIAILLLLFVISWYAGLNTQMQGLLEKFNNIW